MNIYAKLQELQEKNQPIRVGVVGAGQMGYGMICQIASIPGMSVNAISDILQESAAKAAEAYNSLSSIENTVLVSTSYYDVVKCPEVDVVVDATGVPDVGAQIALSCLLYKKHLVLLNVEVDITIGSLMHQLFKSAGLIYTGTDGDEPSATFELYNFAKAMGFEVLVAGKGKNNKLRIEADPDSCREEALSRHMAPHMLAAFADGTKTMAEMTLLSNAIGFLPDILGMHGVSGDLKETVNKLRLKSEGGVLDNYQVVEYVDGLAPGVFVIVKGQNAGVTQELNYMMKTDNDHQILYRPYHLGSLETPITIAKALIFNEPSIVPLGVPLSDTVAVAKKNLKAGEKLDGIGGYCLRGTIDTHVNTLANKYIPIGLIAGNTITKRDISLGTILTEDDVQLDHNTTVWKLRALQNQLIG